MINASDWIVDLGPEGGIDGGQVIAEGNPTTLECRTWDNNGIVEDIATGSAAGPLCAYLVKHGLKKSNEIINIHQGKFINRPSIIQGWTAQISGNTEIFIRGNVSFFASGNLLIF